MKIKSILLSIVCIIIINVTLSTRVLALTNIEEKSITKLNDEEFNPDNLDFEFLKDKVQGKKIIGIGDNNLGIRESNLCKYNLTAYLIKTQNYKSIILDAAVGTTDLLNAYVTKDGYPVDDAIKALIILNNNSEEFRDFVKWVREYNKGKPLEEMVTFHGRLDYRIDTAVSNIISYLKGIDSEAYEKSKEPLYMTSGFSYNYYYLKLPNTEKTLKDIKSLYESFIKNKEIYISKSSELEYNLNLNCYKVVLQKITDLDNYEKGVQLDNRNDIENSILKDILNISYENKAIVWALNMNLTGILEEENGEFTRLGYILRKEYGDDYFAIATDINKGETIEKRFFYSDVTNRPYDEGPIYRVKSTLRDFKGGLIEKFSNIPYNSFYVDTKNYDGKLKANTLNLDERNYLVRDITFDFKSEFQGLIYTKNTTAVNHFSVTNRLRGEEIDHSLFLSLVALSIVLLILSIIWENYQNKKNEAYEKALIGDDYDEE